MRLRTKLAIGFLVSPIFFIGHSIFAYDSLISVREDVLKLQRFTQTTDLVSQAAGEIAAIAPPEDIEVGVMSSPQRPGETPIFLTRVIDRLERARIHLRALKRLSNEPQSKRAVQSSLDVLERYRAAAIDFADAMQTRGPAGARGLERDRAVEAFGQVRALVNRFSQSVGEESRRAVVRVAGNAKEQAANVVGISLVIAVTLTLIIAVTLAGFSTRDVIRLSKAVRRLEAGELDVVVPVRSRDEIGELTRAFNAMTRRLKEIYLDQEDRVLARTEALRRRERELYQSQKMAALGRLSAGIAHELGGPLTIIAASAEGLLDRAAEPELKDLESFEDFPDYLRDIHNEAYRLKKVIRRLLGYARPKSPVMAPLDLVQVTRGVVDLARLDPRARRLSIDFEAGGRKKLEIEGDADRIQEATLNLVFNAIDAVDEAEDGRIAVELDEAEDEVILRVRDNGMGMDADQVQQVFEPFFTTKPEGAGTGLGLALVSGTVQAHNGQVKAESEGPGLGSCFEITLPRVQEQPETEGEGMVEAPYAG